ncbi:MAG TPA: TolC family protein [Polyangia bacterium]
MSNGTRARALSTLALALAWTTVSPRPARAIGDAPAGPPLQPSVAPVSPAAVPSMTLKEALAYARAHQPSLHGALARVEAAAADAQVARAQWLPSFGATAQVFEGTVNNSTASTLGVPEVDLPRIGGTPAGASKSWRPSLSTLAAIGGGQELFDFGRIAAQAAVADVAYETERHRADAERLRVDLLVREAYYGVQGARAVLRAAEDAYHRAGVHRDMAAAGVKSGMHAPIELTRAEADLTRFEVGRVRAQGSVDAARAVFAAAVGVEGPMLEAAGEGEALEEAPPIDSAIRRALDRDPTLDEARSRIRGGEALARAIGAEMRPDLSLTATLSARDGTAANADPYRYLPGVPNWDAGLVLRVPLYDPVVSARRDAAAARVEAVRADLATLTQQERAAVQRAYVALEVSRAALVSLTRAVDAAHANYAQAEARFKAGLGTSLELADAEAVRTDAEIQLAIGRFEALRARAVLGRLTAEGL